MSQTTPSPQPAIDYLSPASNRPSPRPPDRPATPGEDHAVIQDKLASRGQRKTHIAGILAIGCAVCLVFPLTPATGLLAGAFIALTLGNPVHNWTSRGAGWALKAAIVALGAGMPLDVVWKTGADGFGYTLGGLAITLSLGLWLGRRAGLSSELSLLLSTGTAICGGSAIAAMSGAIHPKAHDASVALAVVFLLNAVALFVFPPAGHWLGFSEHQFGLWAALAIHDTSSVAGAAAAYGGTALSVAITVKLARALWIVPITIGASLWKNSQQGITRSLPLKRFLPPGFIMGYLAMAALFTWQPVTGLARITPVLTEAGHRGMTLALFLIGTGLSREALRHTGFRPLGVATVLWIVVSTLSACLLKAGWIN